MSGGVDELFQRTDGAGTRAVLGGAVGAALGNEMTGRKTTWNDLAGGCAAGMVLGLAGWAAGPAIAPAAFAAGSGTAAGGPVVAQVIKASADRIQHVVENHGAGAPEVRALSTPVSTLLLC